MRVRRVEVTVAVEDGVEDEGRVRVGQVEGGGENGR